MLSDAVSLFVIAFTAINILACLWLLWWTAKTRGSGSSPDIAKHGTSADAQQAAGNGVAKTGHVWDGDLEEYNNPLPRWWLGLFVGTILFGAGYLVFYPGLGNFAGLGSWTSVKEYQA